MREHDDDDYDNDDKDGDGDGDYGDGDGDGDVDEGDGDDEIFQANEPSPSFNTSAVVEFRMLSPYLRMYSSTVGSVKLRGTPCCVKSWLVSNLATAITTCLSVFTTFRDGDDDEE